MVGDDAAETDLQLKDIRFLEIPGNPCLLLSLSYLKFSYPHWEEEICFICSYYGCDGTAKQNQER